MIHFAPSHTPSFSITHIFEQKEINPQMTQINADQFN